MDFFPTSLITTFLTGMVWCCNSRRLSFIELKHVDTKKAFDKTCQISNGESTLAFGQLARLPLSLYDVILCQGIIGLDLCECLLSQIL